MPYINNSNSYHHNFFAYYIKIKVIKDNALVRDFIDRTKS
jgi:hypothetical protein